MEIPCNYACPCIEANDEPLHSYYDSFFTIECYRLTYKKIMNPICNEPVSLVLEHNRNEVLIIPPDVPTQPGRFWTRRTPSQIMLHPIKCTRYERSDHNRRTCQNHIEGPLLVGLC
ncbi:hypothetical protein Droror1_Dr00017670 [Drosera rotundifolia]